MFIFVLTNLKGLFLFLKGELSLVPLTKSGIKESEKAELAN